jgi:hypothetical protein
MLSLTTLLGPKMQLDKCASFSTTTLSKSIQFLSTAREHILELDPMTL